MKYSDVIYGNKNIVRAYRGDVLVYERKKYGYIKLADGLSFTRNAYISCLGINAPYETRVTFKLNSYPPRNNNENSNRPTLIGRRWSSGGAYASAIETLYYSNDENLKDYNCRSGVMIYESPHIIAGELTTITYKPERECRYGLWLFGTANNDGNAPESGYGVTPFFINGAYPIDLSLYEVTLINEDNEIVHNLLPALKDGNKGMYDTIHNSFYPCSNNDYFELGENYLEIE